VSVTRKRGLPEAARIAAAIVGFTGAVALVVRLAAARQARELLHFTFPGLPRTLSESADIFANNLRVLVAILAACGAVQLAHDASEAGWERALFRAVIATCDIALSVGSALQALLAGSSYGAYGFRAIRITLAHGPFELGAYSLALGLYVAVRRERVPVRRQLKIAAAAATALAIAAVLEVFVSR
jgi:hypothetical protein